MRLLSTVCLAVLVAAPALAGGPTTVQPEPAPTPAPAAVADFDWTGFYVGAFTGGNGVVNYGSPGHYSPAGVHAGYLRDFGKLVVGGELAYMKGNPDGIDGLDLVSTRAKLIGGLSLGKFMPYAFAGVSHFAFDYDTSSPDDNFTLHGVGARLALGASGRHVIGIEYSVEKDNDFNGFGAPAEITETSIRYDFRF